MAQEPSRMNAAKNQIVGGIKEKVGDMTHNEYRAIEGERQKRGLWSCTGWASRPCMALVMIGLATAFLAVGVATPWYFIWQQDVPLQTICNQSKGDRVVYFTWTGMEVRCEPDGSRTETVDLTWNNDWLHNDSPHQVYLTSLILECVATGLSLFCCFLIIFCLMVPRTKWWCGRVIGGYNRPKYIIFVLVAIVFILVVLGIGLFFRFPAALSSAEFCATNAPSSYWCHEFVGYEDGVGPPTYSSTYTWYPSMGWLFTVGGAGFAAAALLLVGIVRRTEDPDYIGVNHVEYY